jgi:hypothetical protein
MLRAWIQFCALSLLILSPATSLTAARQSSGAANGAPRFQGLQPGKFVTHRQEVPVNIVLIGFNDNLLKDQGLMGWLPANYTPIVRYPRFYGLNGRDMGLGYTFKYSITGTNQGFEDQFFGYLKTIGTERAPTIYQDAYNNQTMNVLDVTGPILELNATSVEDWLVANAKPPRVGYTVYFVNWYGRSDFRFHVYTKKDDPDPDTGHNFGNRQSRAITSWGGTSSRTWFYDFSAGPEWNTNNWVVDVKDLNGDGQEEYRMPPIWEYDANGYRLPSLLGSDMGRLTRFVAINLLFTTSPLYDPLVTATGPGGQRVVDTTILEDDPASNGIDFFDPSFAEARWRSFQPYYQWQTPVRAVDPIDPGAKNALDIFTENSNVAGCWVPFGTPFAQLFCYFTENLSTYVPAYGDDDYVAPTFAFNTTEEGLGSQFGLLGFADDNWVDGTQSMVFAFDADVYRSLGYGFTGTLIHEIGHHIGLSHPHDGYDSGMKLDYGASGQTYFAWEGDESDTVMQYLGLTNRFGEHNRDNMYRWEYAGYMNWSNALLADILASPDAEQVYFLLVEADGLAVKAKGAFGNWRYLNAVTDARAAYAKLVEAADAIGVSSEKLSKAKTPLPESRIEKYVCRPRDLVKIGSDLIP